MTEPTRVLTVGAAGKFAGMLVPALVRRGAFVRGIVTNAEQHAAVLSNGAAESVVGDLRDPTQIAQALSGMDTAFYIAPFALENGVAIGQQFIELAKRAGVRRVIFSSVIHSNLSSLENHAAKLPVETALVESGLEYTILQPAVYFQNITAGWKQTQKTGIHTELWSNHTHFSRVDFRDVAEVASIALTEDRLLYGTFELCAEGNFSGLELSELMGKVLGRQVKAEQGSLPPRGKLPDQLFEMMRWYDNHSLLGSPVSLRAILGKPARTLHDYLVEHLES